MNLNRWFSALCLFIITCAVLTPLLFQNLPYLYLEDETHHINRTLEMAKSGDLNPHYFHKPSLHFYVRLPFAYAGIEQDKLDGKLKSIKEIRTRDPYGLAGYAFTASHPELIKWIRLPSLLLSAGLIAITVLFASRFGLSGPIQFFAGLFVLFSVEFVKNSVLVGVDILMAFFCLLVSYLSINLLNNYTRKILIMTAICCGLAVSSKYNAAPILIVPITAILLNKKSFVDFAYLVFFAALGFIIGSPYIVTEFPLFLEHLQYERWHYAVAGHVGHEAEPGLAQAAFYFNWLVTDGIGYLTTLLALIGAYIFVKERRKEAWVFLVFPLIYALFMISQRANFTRNMIVLIPFFAVMAGVTLAKVKKPALYVLLFIVSILQPLSSVVSDYQSIVKHPESRKELEKIAKDFSDSRKDLAVSGELQLPIQTFSLPGVDAFNPQKTSIGNLFQQGYEYVATRAADLKNFPVELAPKTVIAGNPEDERIPKNPEIKIYECNSTVIKDDLIPTIVLKTDYSNENEKHLWINSRVFNLDLSEIPNTTQISVPIMSPWANQTISIGSVQKELAKAGEFEEFILPVSGNAKVIKVSISDVHSPFALGLSGDKRRLGIAIKGVIAK